MAPCEWVIDIIQEWVLAQLYATEAWVTAKGYLTTSFVDRGDPRNEDWTQGMLTTDGAWHDLDLSGIVPQGTKAVLFTLQCHDNVINAYFQLRTKGNTWTWNRAGVRNQVANIFIDNDIIVAPDSNRMVQYRATNMVWTRIILTIKGWWL